MRGRLHPQAENLQLTTRRYKRQTKLAATIFVIIVHVNNSIISEIEQQKSIRHGEQLFDAKPPGKLFFPAIMAPSALVQRRTHNLLLFQKLLNLRDGASPFTLLLDTVDQSAKPVVEEFMTRAKVRLVVLSPAASLLYVTFASHQVRFWGIRQDLYSRHLHLELEGFDFSNIFLDCQIKYRIHFFPVSQEAQARGCLHQSTWKDLEGITN